MRVWIKSFLDVLVEERFWSWTLVGILFLILGLILRGWVLKPLIAHAKLLDGKLYHKIKSAYFKKSLLGWVFFLASMTCVVTLWQQDLITPLVAKEWLLIVGSLVFFIASLLCHAVAFGIASVKVFRQNQTLK